jgi:hypothetical protein
MTTDYQNFRSWFADLLPKLYPDRNAGFVILMVAFPLLERFLQQKTRKTSNHRKFRDQLRQLFPELRDDSAVQQFWKGYRHKLLHQVALSPENWASHHAQVAISVEPDGTFRIQPVLFAQRVLQSIEEDFATFADQTSTSPFPAVFPLPHTGTDLSASFGTCSYPPFQLKR